MVKTQCTLYVDAEVKLRAQKEIGNLSAYFEAVLRNRLGLGLADNDMTMVEAEAEVELQRAKLAALELRQKELKDAAHKKVHWQSTDDGKWQEVFGDGTKGRLLGEIPLPGD